LIRGNSENDLADRDAALLGAGALSIPGAVIGALLGAKKSEGKWQKTTGTGWINRALALTFHNICAIS
jgi:hypothetical protein